MTLPNLDSEILSDYAHMRAAFESGDLKAAHHLYKRLRSESGIELIPEVVLGKPTRFIHPLGSVLGRAQYAPHLVCYQGVSVGSTVDDERPTFTGPCVLFPHSGVIGPVTVGANVWITAGTIVEARPGGPVVIPDNTVVARATWVHGDGMTPLGCSFAHTDRSVIDRYFTPRRRGGD